MLVVLWVGTVLAAEGPVPDWAGAVSIDPVRTERGATITLRVAPGFHVYGRRERWSIPLEVSAPDARVRVPRGTKTKLTTGRAWVLSGLVPVDVRVDGPPVLQGTIRYQVCTDTACAPPVEVGWITSAP